MDNLEKFTETSLPERHHFYVQNNTLLLNDVFVNFRNKYLEIYELDPVRFPTALVKLDLLLICYYNGKKRYQR